MDVELDPKKTVAENAGQYYERAKKAREKAARLRALLEKGVSISDGRESGETQKSKAKWFERFRWFYSSRGFLVVAGKNANQNEALYKRVMGDKDLFLHAEIVGAPFTVIKNGVNADDRTVQEAAQFAGSYSRAWKFGQATVDVYAVRKEQLTKRVSGEYIKKGGVMVLGEREWFRNTKLGLAIGLYNGRPACFPELCAHLLAKPVRIVPGAREKEEIAKIVSEKTGISKDDVIALLPAGGSEIA
ncbi:MAG: NFACT RNA binding domain-containing protein [Candidatus Micrarchaeia archaeon]